MKHAPRSPLDLVADVLLYAPVGLALQAGKVLPDLAREGRAKLEAPLGVARVIGEVFVKQHQDEVVDRLRQAVDWATGSAGPSQQPKGSGAPTASTASSPTRADAARSGDGSAPAAPAASSTADPVGSVSPAESGLGALDADNLAIPSYGTLSATQVIAHLAGLSRADLEAVRTYESATRKRRTVLQRIDALLTAASD